MFYQLLLAVSILSLLSHAQWCTGPDCLQQQVDIGIDDDTDDTEEKGHKHGTWTLTRYTYLTDYSSTIHLTAFSSMTVTVTSVVRTLTVFEVQGTTVTVTGTVTVPGNTETVREGVTTGTRTVPVTVTALETLDFTTVFVEFSTVRGPTVGTVTVTTVSPVTLTVTGTGSTTTTSVIDTVTKTQHVTMTVKKHCHRPCAEEPDTVELDPIIAKPPSSEPIIDNSPSESEDQNVQSEDIPSGLDPSMNGGTVADTKIVDTAETVESAETAETDTPVGMADTTISTDTADTQPDPEMDLMQNPAANGGELSNGYTQ